MVANETEGSAPSTLMAQNFAPSQPTLEETSTKRISRVFAPPQTGDARPAERFRKRCNIKAVQFLLLFLLLVYFFDDCQ